MLTTTMFQHFLHQFERQQLTELAFESVFRTDFSQPGFVVFEFEYLDSQTLRSTMVSLKHDLDKEFQKAAELKLNYGWLGRFDQQETTPFHRDNAGDTSFLMLGYEPTEIASQLMIADYSKFANEQGIDQEEFYQKWNPIYFEVDGDLASFVSAPDFSNPSLSKIVLINNSNLDQPMPGVLHKAVVENKDTSKSRVINSMMINAVEHTEPDALDASDEEFFKTTDQVSR